jgi:hypothetical protein
MTKLDTLIATEIDDLLNIGARLNQTLMAANAGLKSEQLSEASAWVTRLRQLIRRLYGEKSQHFESYSKSLSTNAFYSLHSQHYRHFTQMLGVAQAVKHDISCGLLTNIKNIVHADVFADFLEMGEHLLEEGYKDAAAVIIGSVLEDTLRKLSERAGLPIALPSGKALTIDPLNTQLAKENVYNKLVQKEITTWAHVRNKAAHGEYSEFNVDHVRSMLVFVQRFASEHLART